jgi:hypothetical protein
LKEQLHAEKRKAVGKTNDWESHNSLLFHLNTGRHFDWYGHHTKRPIQLQQNGYRAQNRFGAVCLEERRPTAYNISPLPSAVRFCP